MMRTMLLTTIAGSLPKPAWLAEPERLWAPWRLPPERLAEGQRDAVLAALKEQEATIFHAQERRFRYYRESKEWIRRNVFLLLGRRARRLPPQADLPPQLALF